MNARSPRADNLIQWVDSLIDLRIDNAWAILDSIVDFPLVLTWALETAKPRMVCLWEQCKLGGRIA